MAYNSIQQTPLRNCILTNKAVIFYLFALKRYGA